MPAVREARAAAAAHQAAGHHAQHASIGHPLRNRSVLDGDDKRSPNQLMVKQIIRNPLFENAMAFIIVFNFAMIIIEADATAELPTGENPDGPEWIAIGGWVVLAIFVIELVLRVYVDGAAFFRDGWNIFDFGVISLDLVCSLLGLILGSAFPVSALRILRLSKLTRVSKVFRVFPELRLMMAGLIGSMRSIFWGMVLLLFALLVWAVIGVQFIHPLNLKLAESGFHIRNSCERCPDAYASVAKALMTLLQESVANDSWGRMTVPIIEEYPAASLYFIGVMMTVSMAVLNLILGVVVNVAMASRDDLAEQMEKEKVVQRVEAQRCLSEVCAAMDADGSGELSKDELLSGYHENDRFRETLEELGILEDELEILWTILDPDKDGQVPYTTFIHKSFSMKESDSMYMLAYIKYYVTRIRDQVLQGQQQLREFSHGMRDQVLQGQQQLKTYMVGTRSELIKIEHQAESFEPLLTTTMQDVDAQLERSNEKVANSKEDLGSAEPPKAGGLPPGKGSGHSLHLLEHDRKILEETLETFRSWREDLGASIAGVNARLDALMPDAAWTQVQQQSVYGLAVRPTQANSRSRLWCCQRDTSQSATESVVGRSRFPLDDVVEPLTLPAAGRSQNINRRDLN